MQLFIITLLYYLYNYYCKYQLRHVKTYQLKLAVKMEVMATQTLYKGHLDFCFQVDQSHLIPEPYIEHEN